jgi:NADPH-dependent 2,4-dienoyl-CoA reductase/sulfur reductase-like enzyme
VASTRLVVVGANAAGMSAAHQALRGAKSRGRDLDVVVLESTDDVSYSACGIPYWIAGDFDDSDDLVARSGPVHRAMGVDLRTGATAVDLDLQRRVLAYRTANTPRIDLPFDQLVLATGAAAAIPGWACDGAGNLVGGVMPVKNLDDGRRWIDRLGLGHQHKRSDARPTPRHAVIVGGGYIGLEMAETLLRRGLDTTLITRSVVMGSLDPDMSARIATHVEAAGVRILGHREVTALRTTNDGSVSHVLTTRDDEIRADVVVLGMGVEPATGLGAQAGLAVGSSGGYQPDPHGRIGDGVWAAGDCCEVIHRLTGEYTFVPLGTHANKQGRVAGENLSGGDVTFGGVLGTAVTRFEAGGEYVEIARTGLSSAQAEQAGRHVVSLVTEGTTASGYMPEASPIATKVLAERDTRALLGLQIVGGHNSAKRIDTGAAGLWSGVRIDDLAQMDLSYAPPFATTWEAVQIAARRLAEQM